MNLICRQTLGLFLAACGILMMVGCAHYNLGSNLPNDVNSVAIGDVSNQTNEPLLSAYARTELPALFMQDGGLRVVSEEKADCVLHTRILDYRLRNIGEVESSSADDDKRLNRTVVYGVNVDLEYHVSYADDRHRPTVPRRVVGHAEFSELADLDVVKKDGLKQAMYDAAEQIVGAITNPW